MIKYKTSLIHAPSITPVEVEREEGDELYIGGKKVVKRSLDYYNYFDTYEEARAFLIDKAEQKLAAAKRHVLWSRQMLEKAQDLREKHLTSC